MAKIDIYYLIITSIIFDLLIGDPKFLIHPVQIIGFLINRISTFYIRICKNKFSLILGGLLLFLITINLSYFSGKYIELNYYSSERKIFWGIIIVFGIASCLATKSLLSSVLEIFNLEEDKLITKSARQAFKNKVQQLVSRDVSSFSENNLRRSATESLTENSVDGIFGPLFWILVGAFFIHKSIYLPGPLSLGFSYKAISTLDSMVGYKYMPFKYLGFFSAKIEDFVTFLPCRLVVLTLPLVSKKIRNYFFLVKKTFTDGRKYDSPNAGISEGIFAYIANIKLGGENIYQDKKILKPILNYQGSRCTKKSTEQICSLIIRLLIAWVIVFSLIFFIF